VMLAFDHGYFQGPTTGLERVDLSIVPLARWANTLMCTRGILRSVIPPSFEGGIVLRASGGPSILKELSNEEIALSIEDALRLNAAALAVQVFIGGEHETKSVHNMTRLVDRAQRYGVPVRGTHAHSWVMCFDDELSAFRSYAAAMPDNCIFLVDTYDTLTGVDNAIKVGLELRAKGHEMLGIRLDSGDLRSLSIAARERLDAAGLHGVSIVASDDLDEYRIAELKQQGAQIGVWGVGTRLITAYDQPALGGLPLALAVPLRAQDGVASHSSQLRTEAWFRPRVAFAIVPVFAFLNAGIRVDPTTISGLLQPSSLGILAGLIVGKPLGIFGAVALAGALGLVRLPVGLTRGHIFGISLIAGAGFTMSFFLVTLSFESATLAESARLAVLLGSTLSGLTGLLFLRNDAAAHIESK